MAQDMNPYNTVVEPHTNADTIDIGGRRLRFIRASDVKTVKPHYIDFPALPLDVVTLISGRAGVGKSTYALHKIARATEGTLDGDYKGTPINVAIFAKEDTQSMQKARLEAAGANLDRVVFADYAEDVEGEYVESDMSIPRDLDLMRYLIEENDIRMICIDPLNSYMQGDTNRKDDVRRALDPLARMAQQSHVSVIGIVHFNKGAGYVSDKMSGSHAFRDVARSVLMVAKDEETEECYVTVDKAQYSQGGQSWKFTLQPCDMMSDDGEHMSIARVANLEETTRTVGEVISFNTTKDMADVTKSRDESMSDTLQFLVDYLQEHEGHASTTKIRKAGEEAGYDWKQLTNVKSRNLDLIKFTRSSQFGYEWALKDMVQTSFDGLNEATLATHEKTRSEKLDNTSISNALEGVYGLATHATQKREKLEATHAFSEGEKLSSKSISNGSSYSFSDMNTSCSLSMSSKKNDDLEAWLRTLPEYAADVDYEKLTPAQLAYLSEKRGGLWARKARDEWKKRKQNMLVDNH